MARCPSRHSWTDETQGGQRTRGQDEHPHVRQWDHPGEMAVHLKRTKGCFRRECMPSPLNRDFDDPRRQPGVSGRENHDNRGAQPNRVRSRRWLLFEHMVRPSPGLDFGLNRRCHAFTLRSPWGGSSTTRYRDRPRHVRLNNRLKLIANASTQINRYSQARSAARERAPRRRPNSPRRTRKSRRFPR